MTEQEHEFDGDPTKGRLVFCVDRRCHEMRVGTGSDWRELTIHERTQVTIFMWEDLFWADVAKIIHRDNWRDWFEKVRGHR